MDLSFALQAESLRYIVENHDRLEKKVYSVPVEIDRGLPRSSSKPRGGAGAADTEADRVS
jgi:adenosylhomocysteinase